MVILQLPVSNYIKKYLIALYGESYKLTINDELGILIRNCLQKKTYYNYKPIKDIRNTHYSIHISISQFEKYGCMIREQQISEIYKTLDFNFRNNIYRQAVINKIKFNIDYKDSVLAYLSSFGISENEMSYSTIRKDFNRKKEKIESQLLLLKN